MKSVLICEDDLGRLEALVQAFSRAGYRTRASRAPEHALRQLQEASCDAVLCGADLREADPLDLVQGLRNLGSDVPVLMIAPEATDALRERLREVGIRRIVDASASPREWVRAVEEAIVERRRDPAAAPAVLVHGTDPELRKTLAQAIAATGLFVLEARDAAEARALTRARRPAPALAVVDLDDGGAALVGDLRAAVPGLYVAAVTRRPEPARLRGAYEAGAATVVSTSCPAPRLAALLRANVDRARRSGRPSEAGHEISGRVRHLALWRRPWRG
ncbi:MAG TPA: response regulator, partial [Planctomycetota bacterium]|nr:response regulator [Planctomycetota bacterium]